MHTSMEMHPLWDTSCTRRWIDETRNKGKDQSRNVVLKRTTQLHSIHMTTRKRSTKRGRKDLRLFSFDDFIRSPRYLKKNLEPISNFAMWEKIVYERKKIIVRRAGKKWYPDLICKMICRCRFCVCAIDPSPIGSYESKQKQKPEGTEFFALSRSRSSINNVVLS